jgi:tRNA (guanine-N7-)-methyltransferase
MTVPAPQTSIGPVIRPRSNYAGRLSEFPGIVLADEAAFAHRNTWGDFFRQRIGPRFNGRVIFEIGCFDAVYLARIAAKYPETAFVGLDWKCKAIYLGAAHISALGLANIVLLRGRGQEVSRIFGEREIDEVWLFHPDPCDKPIELKNRLIAAPFLQDLTPVLKSDGLLCLKTDHFGYYESAMSACGASALQHRFKVTANSNDFWNDPAVLAHTSSRCFANETTLFERRFLKKKHPIHYFEIRKS